MANAQEIEFFIDENGELKVHIKGIKGSACAAKMDELVKGLGGTEKSRELTPEYYEKGTTKDSTQIKG